MPYFCWPMHNLSYKISKGPFSKVHLGKEMYQISPETRGNSKAVITLMLVYICKQPIVRTLIIMSYLT